MNKVPRRALLAALVVGHLLTSTGCTVWTRTPVTGLAEPLPSKLKVWVHDSAFVVHDPIIRNDSLLGWERLGKNRGAELVWPASAVDSLRTKQVTVSGTILMGVVVSITVLSFLLAAALSGYD